MPYLSRIPLNPLRAQTQRLLRNPQALHAAVLGGLAGQVDERVLWRDERAEHDCSVLVLTQSEPSWEHLVEQAGWAAEGGMPKVRDLTPLLDRVTVGREFGFRVRANPVQTLPRSVSSDRAGSESLQRGVRVGHRTVGNQLRWFTERTATDRHPWGFVTEGAEALGVRVMSRERVSFSKGRGTARVTLNRVTYEGRLVVRDTQSFRDALLGGIGPGKAYGCGLLTLAAVPDVVAG